MIFQIAVISPRDLRIVDISLHSCGKDIEKDAINMECRNLTETPLTNQLLSIIREFIGEQILTSTTTISTIKVQNMT